MPRLRLWSARGLPFVSSIDGPTIPPDNLAKLKGRFERAGRKSAPGTGLGLSIVEEIMRQAGGHLELFSPARGRRDGFEAVLVFPTKPVLSGSIQALLIRKETLNVSRLLALSRH